MKTRIAIAAAALACGVLQAGTATATPTLWSGNGHYYEFVTSETGFTFSQALAAADSQTYLGMNGYLVTITSAGEQAFLNTLTGVGPSVSLTPIQYYMAASDAATEGDWKWIDGPEAGSSFDIGGVTQPGFYADWSPGEPNNSGGDEDYAMGNWNPSGQWNDVNGTQTLGYVVEFSPVPEPGALAVLGLGLAGLGALRRRRRG